MVKEKKITKKEIPGEIKLISIFLVILGVQSLFIGIISSNAYLGFLAKFVLIPIGIIELITAWGLWTGKNWARILAIITFISYTILLIVQSFILYKNSYSIGRYIYNMIYNDNFIEIFIYVIIIIYLLKKAKEYFKN